MGREVGCREGEAPEAQEEGGWRRWCQRGDRQGRQGQVTPAHPGLSDPPQSTSMISNISRRVMRPSPSRSYISKAQLSFCSKLPREVTDRAQMNSRKSMVPSPFLSKVRKACCANLEASP